MKLLILTFLSLISFHAFGYANFIGHSYTSCLNCHFNPFGGGPLNDYGRVVSATAISSRALFPDSMTDERLAYASGFLFRKPKQDWLRTQVNYRGFRLVNNPGSAESEEVEWMNMQADARVIVKLGQNDKFVAVMNYGKTPVPQTPPPGEEQPLWRSREHYIGYRFSPSFGVYAGLMDKVFGIRVIEHIAYVRAIPQLTMNDQSHGVVAHYLGENFELGVNGFMGNMEQDADLRMKGASLMVERTIFDIHRIGASFMKHSNQYQDLMSFSVHTRLNLKEGSAVLGELGQTTRTTDEEVNNKTSRYGLLQTYLRPWRGIYFFTNIEYLMKDVELDEYNVRWGPGVQYFPIQRLELRFDIYNTRNFSPESSTYDSWMYLLQTHIWL